MPSLEDQKKKGKSLSIISSGIIVYILAGGTFSGSGNLILGNVEFERPEVVVLCVLLYFFYSMYRYYLVRPKPFRDFKAKSIDNLKRDKPFKRALNKVGKEDFYRKKDNGELKLRYNLRPKSVGCRLITTGTTFKEREDKYLFRIAIMQDRNKLTTFYTEVSPLKFWYYVIRTCFYKEDFWVIIFPWLLSVTALILLIVKSIFY